MNKASPRRITITGDPGSGKSTFARNVAARTGFRLITTGTMFRELAARRGLSVTELNQQAESQGGIDEQVDSFLRSLNTSTEDLILDSRMAWHFVENSFRIRLTVSPEMAAERIFSDTGKGRERHGSREEAVTDVMERRMSERRRYQNLYGVDISNADNFDLVIDTTDKSAEEVMAVFERAYFANG